MQMIVFYDKMDNDGRGARAVFELAHENEDVLYIGLDRDMMISEREIFKCSLFNPNDFSTKKVHYMDYLEESGKRGISDIYMLDFAPRYDKGEKKSIEAERLFKYSNALNIQVTIIDHHRLEYDISKYLFDYIYTDGVSACMLTWKHFFKNENAPYVVELINDRDVWINNMQPQTNYLHNVSEMMNQQELLNVIKDGIYPYDSAALKAWFKVGKIREASN